MYQKGLHIISSIEGASLGSLQNYQPLKELLETVVVKYGLQKLGEVYHNFQPEGFTAVVCLSESHISVHTWPEYNLVNYDIYLSNYKRVNDDTVKKIDEELRLFFSGTLIHSQEITR